MRLSSRFLALVLIGGVLSEKGTENDPAIKVSSKQANAPINVAPKKVEVKEVAPKKVEANNVVSETVEENQAEQVVEQAPVKQAPAAQRIKAEEQRIEEVEKSVDDLSSQDTLPTIADSEYCAVQVRKLCSRKVQKDDYLVYNCLEQAASNGKLVDEDCQHFLWIWKHAQTENPDIQEDAKVKCRKNKIQDIAPGK